MQMFRKIKTNLFLQQLRDVRARGLLGFGVIAVMVTWSGVKAVQVNYGLQKQISRLTQENEVQELTNNNLKLKNEYLNTDQFLELAARRQFGLGAPGEKLLIVPKPVALAHTVEPPSKNKTKTTEAPKPAYQRNFQAWIDFFLHRPVLE